VFGGCIGALLAGSLLKIGRRKAYIIANFIMIVGVIPTLFLSVTSIIIGRLIAGVATGIFLCTLSRQIEENVPASKMSIYGPFIASSGSLGSMLATLMGNALPDDKSKELESTNAWRFVFGFPLILSLI